MLKYFTVFGVLISGMLCSQTHGHKTITDFDEVLIQNSFYVNDSTLGVFISGSSDFTIDFGSNVTYDHILYLINEDFEIIEEINFTDILYEKKIYNPGLGSVFYDKTSGELSVSGRVEHKGLNGRLFGKYNLTDEEFTVTDSIFLEKNEYWFYGDNTLKVNDTTLLIADYVYGKPDWLLSYLFTNGKSSSNRRTDIRIDRIDYKAVLASQDYLIAKNMNLTPVFFDLNNDSIYTDGIQELASYPVGNLIEYNNFFYGIGAWEGIDDDGYIDEGWEDRNRPFDLFIYKFNDEFQLIEKNELTDKEWDQQIHTLQFRTQPYIVEDNALVFSYTSFHKDKDVSPGFGNRFTGEKQFDTKLTFCQFDLEEGKVLEQKDFFNNDGKNHFTWFIHKNRKGYMLVNTVLDTETWPDTVTNVELMQLDNNGDILSVKTITNFGRKEISVYPNPAQDYIQFELPFQNDGQSYTYQILSSDGKVVSRGQQLVKRIDIQELPKGNYLLRVKQSNGEKCTSRFVVE